MKARLRWFVKMITSLHQRNFNLQKVLTTAYPCLPTVTHYSCAPWKVLLEYISGAWLLSSATTSRIAINVTSRHVHENTTTKPD